MSIFNIKNSLIVAATLAVTASGCKKSDFAINDNPNSITESTVDYRTVLPASQTLTASIIAADWKFAQNYMGFWARSGSFQDITDEESYNFENDFNAQVWNDLYRNNANYNVVQNGATAAGAGFYAGIARIMKAHNFGLLVDVYNNVPYSQALQGTGNLLPAYDKGVDIYKDLFRQIDTAFMVMKDATTGSTLNNLSANTFDLMFGAGGTQTQATLDAQKLKWYKFGNTVKLRLLIHAAAVPGFPVADEMAKITAEGSGFMGAGENAQINPGYSTSKPNPFYRSYVANEAGTATTNSSLVKANFYAVGTNGGADGYYGYNGDPRLQRFYTAGTLGYRGIQYGEISGTNPDNVGGNLAGVNGPGLLPNGASSRAWILTSVESLFLQAEARHRNIITTGTAQALVTAAVRESFVWLGLTSAQADAYLSLNAGYVDVDYTFAQSLPGNIPAAGPQGGLYTIISQKWFALNAIAPFEVWTDWRRTKIVYGIAEAFRPGPPLSVNPARQPSAQIPRRLQYPQNEYNFNGANVGGEGVITETTPKIFWDL